jgi:hypothetical protein
MASLRRLLGPLAIAWLLCQGTGIALGPVTLWVASAEPELECTCTHGDHSICPMHHRPTATPRCAIRAAADVPVAALVTLLAGAGLMPPAASTLPRVPTSTAMPIDNASASVRTAPPDSPPPRA